MKSTLDDLSINLQSFCSEVGGRTVCRLLVRDAAGDSESTLLHETAPQWVTDVVIERNIPKFLKIPFFLQPHPQMTKPERTKKVKQNQSVISDQICKLQYLIS